MKKTLGVLTVLLCATPMVYAQSDGNAALKSSDVAVTLNGVVAKGKVIDSGSCGENVNYELYDDYTLRIFGSGRMTNFDHIYDYVGTNAPWGDNSQWITKIKSVVIEDGVTRIGSHAFLGCSSLTEVIIPNSVTSIGHEAFRDCGALAKIDIPNSVTSIGTAAFQSCISLAEVNLPNGLETIENRVFLWCNSLTHINIPSSVTRIEDDAFLECTSLTEIIIPDSVTYIGDGAFCNCDNLEYVKIGKGVTTIMDGAFLLYHADPNVKTVVEITGETPVTLATPVLHDLIMINNAFANPEKVIIRVPETMLDYYRSAEDWSPYKESISGYGTTGISSVGNVQSAMKADVVYDLQGHRVTEMLPNRIYIVNGKKVMNK